MPVNEYGQMIGESMEGYTPGALPSIDFLEGRYARIEALSVEKHAEDLLAVYGPDTPLINHCLTEGSFVDKSQTLRSSS